MSKNLFWFFPAFFLILIFVPDLVLALELGDPIIVIADSIPLRNSPNDNADIAKYAAMSLQLKVLKKSTDGDWYYVRIGEQKGYQLKHSDRYWVYKGDVFEKSELSYSTITLDMSVLENGDLAIARRISSKEYLRNLKSITLDSNYYIGCVIPDLTDEFTYSPHFSIGAIIYRPGRYYKFEGDEEHTDASDHYELIQRYSALYENGKATLFYILESPMEIESVKEKLICAKIIMAQPGCYAEEYIGTEMEILSEQTYSVNDNRFLSSFPLRTDYFFQTGLDGGVQYINFLYILDVIYANKKEETIVKRIVLSWPKCL